MPVADPWRHNPPRPPPGRGEPTPAATPASTGRRHAAPGAAPVQAAGSAPSSAVVAAVAQRRLASYLAAAKKHFAAGRRLISDRAKIRTLVRAVAKRLAFALPASAPEIGFACLHFDRIWAVLRAHRFRHGELHRDNNGRQIIAPPVSPQLTLALFQEKTAP